MAIATGCSAEQYSHKSETILLTGHGHRFEQRSAGLGLRSKLMLAGAIAPPTHEVLHAYSKETRLCGAVGSSVALPSGKVVDSLRGRCAAAGDVNLAAVAAVAQPVPAQGRAQLERRRGGANQEMVPSQERSKTLFSHYKGLDLSC